MYKELYLMLTEACPNRCEYCYIKNRTNPSRMSLEQIDKLIEKHHPRRIIFFGGEPLLEIDLIEQVLEKYYGQIKFQMVTSTSVNYREFITRVNSKYPLNELQLSWDGFNNNRIDKNGTNISQKVYENILWTIEQGVSFDIKCVISNNNVQFMSDIHEEFVRLSRIGKEKGIIVSGQFVIAHRDLYTHNFFPELKEELQKTFTLEKMYSEHLNKIIAIMQNDRNFGSCDVGKYTVITPDGRESNCTALSQNSIDFKNQDLQERCKHPDCQTCKYSMICDGGCRFERINEFGDDWENNYLKSTCALMEVWYETVQNFLKGLTQEEKYKLYSIMSTYAEYLDFYYNEEWSDEENV